MSTYDVAFIGTGPEPDNPVWGESAAMAYRHAEAYDAHPSCVPVACADIVAENARAFADRVGIDSDAVFTDYEAMLEAAEPDVVSVSTPVATHEGIVVDCAERGVPAIHCEKPMADTLAGSRRMRDAAEQNDIQLTFNHQRRVATPSQEVARLVEEGAVGDVARVEFTTRNLYDSGTHYVDLCNCVLGDPDPEWVIGQIDYRTENVRYGVHNENEAFVRWRYADGVDAVAATGRDDGFLACSLRVLGTDGEIQLGHRDGQQIRVKYGETADWDSIDTGEPLADIPAAIEDVVNGLETDAEPELSADRALSAMEIIFGAYESSRRRARVDLPPAIDGNPLIEMVEEGSLSPDPDDA